VLLKADALRETHLPPESIEFEITENSRLNHDDAIETLQKLHEKGVKIAFDDFGTGYASLSYLTRFPLSRIKIDRSFVRKIPDDADAAAIVRSLIVMGHNLGLEVIAEGVETEAQAAFLLAEGCEEAQGCGMVPDVAASSAPIFFATAGYSRIAGSAPAMTAKISARHPGRFARARFYFRSAAPGFASVWRATDNMLRWPDYRGPESRLCGRTRLLWRDTHRLWSTWLLSQWLLSPSRASLLSRATD